MAGTDRRSNAILRSLLQQQMSKITPNEKIITAASFMIIGAVISVMIMALFIPAKERGLLELKLGMAIGAFLGFAIFRLTARLTSKQFEVGESLSEAKDDQ
jgi:hypothetical protein